MPHILKLKDGTLHLPFGRTDLLWLIEDKLGREAREAIEDEMYRPDARPSKPDVALQEAEMIADEYRAALVDVLRVTEECAKSRSVNKQELARRILREVNNTI